MSKNRIIRGTLILTCAGLLSRFIGFFYRIFLSHTIGAQGLGLFQLVLPIQGLVMAVSVSGLQTAISRLCASHMALGRKKAAGDFFWAGSFLSVMTAAVLSWLIQKNADFFAAEILKAPQTSSLIRILAFSFPLSALHSCVNSYYFALKRTEVPSAIQLLEQVVRVGSCYLLSLIFISEGRPVTPLIAAGGALASEAVSAFVSLFCIGSHFHKIRYTPFRIQGIQELCRELLGISLPLTLNRILLTVLGSMEMILIPQRLRMYGLSSRETLSIYGIFTGMAMPLILFPGTLTNSAAVMLMPSVAQLQALGKKERICRMVKQLFYCCSLMGVACMLLFLLFGNFLGNFLFHSAAAGTYIRTLSFICPFLYLNTTLTSVLHGLGKTGMSLLHSVISLSIRIVFILLAVPLMGIRGYLYGILFAELILTLLHTLLLSRLARES